MGRHPTTSAFARYVEHLLELCEVDFQSIEADKIRDEMDGPWLEMSDRERELATRVAVALTS